MCGTIYMVRMMTRNAYNETSVISTEEFTVTNIVQQGSVCARVVGSTSEIGALTQVKEHRLEQ